MTKVFVQCVPGLFKKKVSVQCVRGVFDQECESLKNNEGVKLEEKHFIKILCVHWLFKTKVFVQCVPGLLMTRVSVQCTWVV